MIGIEDIKTIMKWHFGYHIGEPFKENPDTLVVTRARNSRCPACGWQRAGPCRVSARCVRAPQCVGARPCGRLLGTGWWRDLPGFPFALCSPVLPTVGSLWSFVFLSENAIFRVKGEVHFYELTNLRDGLSM